MSRLSPNDPNSYSRPEEVKVIAVHLKWNVDFSRKIISGFVTLTAEQLTDASQLILDTRDIKIHSVKDEETGQLLQHSMGDAHPNFGSALTIALSPSGRKQYKITIEYEVSASCTALQWLSPGQTAGKKHPYLFSQCQAIHCRSLLPCQDTPAAKITYTAEVTVDNDLVALMSALRDEEHPPLRSDKGVTYKFRQPVPIPAYLIAIAVGALESRKIGPRSHVWSEKEFVEKAAYEFAETEQMLATAESLCGEYVWGQYDLLILPPSFPYGGMENPCLTFVTPTLLAGDKSLADVVVHEITHSWTGNLVTNANWEHFWLNEGFTKFIERKIVGERQGITARSFSAIGGWNGLTECAGDRSLADVVIHEISHSWTGNLITNSQWEHFWLNEGFTMFVQRKIEGRLHGKLHRDFSALGGWKDLTDCIQARGEKDPLTCLIPDLTGVDPDDAFSTVPYEKGHTFLWYLESLVGGPGEFEPFLRAYLDKFKFKSITSDTFKDFLLEYFADKKTVLEKVDWNLWWHTPGMPPHKPEFDETLAATCTDLRQKWVNWDPSKECSFVKSDLNDMSSNQISQWLAQLLECEPLSITKLEKMEELYGMSSHNNAEIKFRWLRLGLKSHWPDCVDEALKFITEQGRMKFVRPIYRDFYAWEEMRSRAIATFKANKDSMMHVAAYVVAKDLHLSE